MMNNLEKKITIRLQDIDYEYFRRKAAGDRRKMSAYLRIVLENVREAENEK